MNFSKPNPLLLSSGFEANYNIKTEVDPSWWTEEDSTGGTGEKVRGDEPISSEVAVTVWVKMESIRVVLAQLFNS
ncbi:hypothetical protein RRG08_031314 [Elysia crispata]|uniref:Uncharacterized protein n=1 Tax=Elysia crispata TaxID=231223 RepID=A0AAE0YJ99_9GAST|nr:hypothetical protein RRG08_031314 [Elysia crispata]